MVINNAGAALGLVRWISGVTSEPDQGSHRLEDFLMEGSNPKCTERFECVGGPYDGEQFSIVDGGPFEDGETVLFPFPWDSSSVKVSYRFDGDVRFDFLGFGQSLKGSGDE